MLGGVESNRPASAAELRALAHPLRLRILRLCLDEALTNEELARRLGRDPASVLHHVRTLVRTGFLGKGEPEPGPRGSRRIPYRATGRSWGLGLGEDTPVMLAMVDAFRAELAEAAPAEVLTSVRLGVRLAPEDLDRLVDSLKAVVLEARALDRPDGEPVGFYIGAHRRRS
jgi:DNA-binding transcriptional ArsR family regulator